MARPGVPRGKMGVSPAEAAVPDYSVQIEQAIEEPLSAASDGQSATARSADDLIKLINHAAGQTGLDGTNANGGPKSGWGRLRTARAIPPGAV